MRRLLFPILLLAAVSANVALAQVYTTPGGSLVVPPPPRPAPPQITVPTVPQMNSPPKFELQNTTPSLVEQDAPPKRIKPLSRRKSFGSRITRCLQEGAAMGLGPGERARYSRSCAQQ